MQRWATALSWAGWGRDTPQGDVLAQAPDQRIPFGGSTKLLGVEDPHKTLKNRAITAARIKVREVALLDEVLHSSMVT